MKTFIRSFRGLVVIVSLAAGLTAFAQSIQFFTLGKIQGFTQTGVGIDYVAANTDTANDSYPWRFEANINGTSLDGSSLSVVPHVTTSSGSTTAFDLGFVEGPGWEYRPGFTSQSALDSALGNGTFTTALAVTGSASPFALSMTGDLYPNRPIATLTGGTWTGGTYVLNAGAAWTIDSGVYDTNFLDTNSRIEIQITGPGNTNYSASIGAGNASNALAGLSFGNLTASSVDVNAPTFLTAGTYNVDIRFARITDFQPDIGAAIGQAAGTAQAAALYQSLTSFTLTAVPEPATYAIWAGALAFGLAAWRRRTR